MATVAATTVTTTETVTADPICLAPVPSSPAWLPEPDSSLSVEPQLF
jgi:hypothetical protein